jgi:hypothetical protein
LDNSDFVQEFGYDQSNEEHAIVLSHQIAQNFIINDNDYENIYSCSLELELFQVDDSKFIDRSDISSNVSNCVCYDQIVASRFNENQAIHMQPFFHEFHEMKIFEIEVLKSLNNQPVYDKYQYYEEHISTSAHMEFYNSDLLYDNFEIKFQESNKEDILASQGSPYRITVEEDILLPFILKGNHQHPFEEKMSSEELPLESIVQFFDNKHLCISLVHDEYETSDEECQADLLFSFVLKDVELDEIFEHGDTPVEQPYLITGIEILEKT